MIPQEIKELRAKLGLTQEALARKLGVSLFTVCRWEQGRSKPSPMAQTLLKIFSADVSTSAE